MKAPSAWKVPSMDIRQIRITPNIRIKDLETICPYWDICATVQFHNMDKRTFILNVCTVDGNYQNCTHYIGLDVFPEGEISRIREAMREKYGEPKTNICGWISQGSSGGSLSRLGWENQ